MVSAKIGNVSINAPEIKFNTSELFRQLINNFPGLEEKIIAILGIIKFLIIVFIIYLVFLIVKKIMDLKNKRNFVVMSKNLININKKLERVIELLEKKKKKDKEKKK